jgi:hypothetical protein
MSEIIELEHRFLVSDMYEMLDAGIRRYFSEDALTGVYQSVSNELCAYLEK